ncbi:carboxylesterase [Granulicatella balaenopterae]|uniref:Carboxylesterase n=1 Tax=Granulicatella balaenopterae TaxID=137733 RepID=A0A1H9HPA6_9LACT|nr:alpha/beta fold hydrolase [Granulicatella balaenopterae]SEQ64096.1 carboxylesterase [Granulicatella balaenopterae]
MKMIRKPSSVFLEGNQQGIVLFHAYTGSSNDVRMLAKRLHQEGYTVYCPNYSAHVGNDIDDFLSKTPNQWWKESQEAIEFLREQGCQKVYAFGLSMGGIMATLAAEKHFVDAAGVFCSPITEDAAQLDQLKIGLQQYCEHKLNEQGRPQTDIIYLQKAMDTQLMRLTKFSKMVYHYLDHVTCPFYIAQGAKDEISDPQSAYVLKDKLINSLVDFHWFEESGHVITISRDRREFQESVITFMENN